jgi:ribosome-associated translation inhibitor RaiA
MEAGMSEQLVFHNCPTTIKQGVRDYWARKAKRIQRLLDPFPAEQQHLRLAVRPHAGRADQYELRGVLTLPTGTLVAEARSNLRDFHEALDLVVDRLGMEIRRHKSHLRRGDFARRKGGARTSGLARMRAVPFISEQSAA